MRFYLLMPLLLFCAGFLLISSRAWSEPADAGSGLSKKSSALPILTSQIVNVTVFSDRALVTRRAQTDLDAGDHRLLFDKLPGDLDVNSVQVKGKGTGLIKGVSIQSLAVAGTEDQDLRQLKKQKSIADVNVKKVQDEISQAKKEKEFIEAIAKRLTTATDKSESAEFNPKKWIEMVAFYREKLTALDQEIRETTERLPGLQEEQARIEEEIQKIQRDQRGKYRVEVWMEMPKAGEVTLDLDYIVSGPHWYPRYDVRADSKQAMVQITYRGMIIQNTSEDWTNVSMTLSTAQPQAGGQHPDLTAWRVSPYVEDRVPMAQKRRSQKFEAASQMFNRMPAEIPAPEPMRDGVEEESDLAVNQAVVDSGATAVVFNLKGPQTVRSDNQPQDTTILVHEFPAAFRYSTAPKLAARAYLKAKVKNATDFPLLAGQTSLFLDNNFVANGQLNGVAPNEEFWAFLGVDDGIKVEHKLINRKEESEGVFGGKTRVTFEYLIQVTNHKKQAREIAVWDQMPLSGSGDIQVELLEPAYKADSDVLKKNAENILEWLYQVEPGQVVKIPLKFTVSFPKNLRVQGL